MDSPFYTALRSKIADLGGLYNAHLHLDRACTLNDGYVDFGHMKVLENSHISLQRKHALIRSVHEGQAYDSDELEKRITETLDVMMRCGTAVADTMIDVTPDRVGTRALDIMQEISARYRHKITVNAAAYTPLGFPKDAPQAWSVFEEGVKKANFIGSLPEADDVLDYPNHIGFEEHCVRMLDLASRTGKMLHVHTDQVNSEGENGTERLIEVMKRETGRLSLENSMPQVWAVHMISPSLYDKARWERFIMDLKSLNIGVISCPSAALGMRQLRGLHSVTANSIPRVLELAAAGIHLRLGSDNIADMCSPSTTADLVDEVFVLSAAIRYYKIEILAKFAAGQKLTVDEQDIIKDHLIKNETEMVRLIQRFPASS